MSGNGGPESIGIGYMLLVDQLLGRYPATAPTPPKARLLRSIGLSMTCPMVSYGPAASLSLIQAMEDELLYGFSRTPHGGL